MLGLLFYVIVLKDQAEEDLPGSWKTERDEMA